MSARKATRGHKRGDARMALLGVYAVCELVHSSYTASRTARIVLTRGSLQPLRDVLELLGEEDIERFLWGEDEAPRPGSPRGRQP